MKLSGRYVFDTDKETLWKLLNDPEVLKRATPGCERMEKISEDEYAATLKVGVAAVKGTYDGKIAIAEKDPPHAYTLKVEGSGGPGYLKGYARFTLDQDGQSRTVLSYDGEGEVGGLIASIGGRILEGVAKFLVGQFMKGLQREARAHTAQAG